MKALLDSVISLKRKVSKALIPYESSMDFFYSQLIGAMYCVFVIGPGTFRKEAEENVEAIAELRADVGYQFILFIQIMSAVGNMVGIQQGYKRLTGNASRFVELRKHLAEIRDKESTKSSKVVESNSIKFEHVMVYTPAGDGLQNKLVNDLTFEVAEKESMLLTGSRGR